MGLLKDWIENNNGYRIRTRVARFFDPREWLKLHKWRKQRADRGWSDRDTWGAGDHIAKMTAEMLQHLNDNTYVDWPQWFKLNVKEKGRGTYKSLQQVVDDIENYLAFEETSWADGLTTKNDSLEDVFKKRSDDLYEYQSPDWYDGDKKLSQKEITRRIYKWSKQSSKEYEKAKNAMSFFARHFSSFWD